MNKARFDAPSDPGPFQALEKLIPDIRKVISGVSEKFLNNMSSKGNANPSMLPPITLSVESTAMAARTLSSAQTITLIANDEFPSSIFDPLRSHWRNGSFSIHLLDSLLEDPLFYNLLSRRDRLMEILEVTSVRIQRFPGWTCRIRVGGLPHHVPDEHVLDLIQNEWGVTDDHIIGLPFRPIRSFSNNSVDESSVEDMFILEVRRLPPTLHLLTMAKFGTFEAFGTRVWWSLDLPPAHLRSVCLLCGCPHHWSVCGLPETFPDVFNNERIAFMTKSDIPMPVNISLERKPNPHAWVSLPKVASDTQSSSPAPSTTVFSPPVLSYPSLKEAYGSSKSPVVIPPRSSTPGVATGSSPTKSAIVTADVTVLAKDLTLPVFPPSSFSSTAVIDRSSIFDRMMSMEDSPSDNVEISRNKSAKRARLETSAGIIPNLITGPTLFPLGSISSIASPFHQTKGAEKVSSKAKRVLGSERRGSLPAIDRMRFSKESLPVESFSSAHKVVSSIFAESQSPNPLMDQVFSSDIPMSEAEASS